MKARIYKTVFHIGVWLLSAALFITPAYAASVTEYKGAANDKQNKPILSDTEFIQQLIDKTNPGEICRIPEGEYTVTGLSLTRPIQLNGGENVTLRYYNWHTPNGKDKPMDESYIFAVWSDGVLINGINFVNADTPASTGILHMKGENLEIRDNVFSVGQDSAGIISRAAVKQCVVDGNIFTAESGRRSFPMIQFGKNSNGARIKNNILEGNIPDMLTSNFLSNFLSVESDNALVADNEFLYTGPWSEEDIGGYEDSDTPIAAQEAFAEMTKSRMGDMNPWTRGMEDKSNPETGDGFNGAVIGIIGVIQIAAGTACVILRSRGRLNR